MFDCTIHAMFVYLQTNMESTTIPTGILDILCLTVIVNWFQFNLYFKVVGNTPNRNRLQLYVSIGTNIFFSNLFQFYKYSNEGKATENQSRSNCPSKVMISL